MPTIEEVMKQKETEFNKTWKDIIIPYKPIQAWPVISSGIPSLDLNLGTGGYPIGRIIEIYGNEGAGKTTLALYALKSAQENNMSTAFIDMEHGLDLFYADKLGISVKDVVFAEPDFGEQAMDFTIDAIRSGIRFIVVDSVATLVPKAEIEGEMVENKIGLHARLMSKFMRVITPEVKKNNAIVLFINQLREKIGVTHGDPSVTTGGNALKFYASLRMDVRRSQEAKDNSNSISTIRIKKNKLCAKGNATELKMIYGNGFDIHGSVLDVAVDKGVIKANGSWYSYMDTKIGQGRDNAVGLLRDNIEMYEEIKKKVYAK